MDRLILEPKLAFLEASPPVISSRAAGILPKEVSGAGQQISDVDLAWAAGLLEGEGSFFICRNDARGYRTPCVEIAMTDQDCILKIAKILCSNNKIRIRKSKCSRHKDVWVWRARYAPAVHIMQLILPHMGVRRSAKIREILNEYLDKKRAVVLE